jgi:hypothetical protein
MQRVDELFFDVVGGISTASAERGQVGEQAGGAHDGDVSDSLGEFEHAGVYGPEGDSATLVDLAQIRLLDRVAERAGEAGVRDIEVQAGRRRGKGAVSSRPAQPLTAQAMLWSSAGARLARSNAITSLVVRWAMRVGRGASATAADHEASMPSASMSCRYAPGPRSVPRLAVQPESSNALRTLAAWASDQSLSSASTATRSGRSSPAWIVWAIASPDFDHPRRARGRGCRPAPGRESRSC